MKRLLGIAVSLAALAVSCTMWDTADYEGALKGLALMTPIAENEENTLSKATLPLWDGGALASGIVVSDLTTTGASKSGSISNYPEKLQTTTYTVTNKGNNVYFIKTVTTYPGNSIREVTYENYYLKDNDGDKNLTNADPVCKADGTEDPLYRDKFETTFGLLGPKNERVSSVRKETIQEVYPSVSYASFTNVDLSSLRTLGTLNYSPTTDNSAQYSSRVTYTQSFTKEDATKIGLDYYLGTVTAVEVTGTRYYTEIKTGNITECSALYIEDFKDGTGALIGRTATKYWYTIDSLGKRSNKTVVGKTVFKTKNGNKVMDL
jgi:hypothetical protein